MQESQEQYAVSQNQVQEEEAKEPENTLRLMTIDDERGDLLNDQSSLGDCLKPYRQELLARGKSQYTVTCFLSDLKILIDSLGMDTPVGRVRKEDLTNWLMKLKFGVAGRVPAPKTMARRVTFLKNFFVWLTEKASLREDPSDALVLERPMPPLPELLSDDDLQRLEHAAQNDSRSACLITIFLHAGLKKEEVMHLQQRHISLLDAAKPSVMVQLAPNSKKLHRERTLTLPAHFTAAYQQYLQEYKPVNTVFNCTDRNLNYILLRVVKEANITNNVTLQLLRDMFAVRQLRAGESLDSVREQLGLSSEAWSEAKEKYRRLALLHQ